VMAGEENAWGSWRGVVRCGMVFADFVGEGNWHGSCLYAEMAWGKLSLCSREWKDV